MMIYITDFVIIGLQCLIIFLVGRWIHELMEIKRAIIRNRYTTWRQVLKDGKKD